MTGIILMAAGSSSRLGQPKQNLIYQGTSLLRRTAETSLEADLGPVVVVLGANTALTEQELQGLAVEVAHNSSWAEGMSSSIKTGLQTLLKLQPNTQRAILLVCDQPFVDVNLLHLLRQTQQETGKEIIACAYGDTLGTPALFEKTFFPQLLSLTGQEGAKKLFFRYPDALASIPFPQGETDIDTQSDYQALLQQDPS